MRISCEIVLQEAYNLHDSCFLCTHHCVFTLYRSVALTSLYISRVYAGETPPSLLIPLPEWLSDNKDVFDTEQAGMLPPHNRYDYAIKLNGDEPLYGPLYNLLVTELKFLREYLDNA